ncbi:hypothetical protein MMC12_005159 [Toensbergia leucococca]|nr:hypothetical protein [Toensbergia leucococca]
MSSPSHLHTYHGNCHCGAFKYTVKLPELKQIHICNCSLCVKNGYMWAYPIVSDALVVEKGENTLQSYEFAGKGMAHEFCPTCGTSVLGRRHNMPEGAPSVFINVRTISGMDLDALKTKPFDGKAMGSAYQPPEIPAHPKEPGSDQKVYSGNCHCGAVTYTVHTAPLTTAKVVSCNCSICARNGDLWIYPPTTAVTLHGEEALKDYSFAKKTTSHRFCGTCGVSVVVKIIDLSVLQDGEDEPTPINVRTMNDVDVEALNLVKYDGWSKMDPPYEV